MDGEPATRAYQDGISLDECFEVLLLLDYEYWDSRCKLNRKRRYYERCYGSRFGALCCGVCFISSTSG